jgi:tetratricopeptide (TPR) repeat protein
MASGDEGMAGRRRESARARAAIHSRSSQHFEGWIALADALWSLARDREARAALKRADRLVAPKVRYRVWAQWGHFYKEKGDLNSAARWYRKAVAAKPSMGRHVFLAAVLARQGSFAAAKVQYRAAIRRASDGDRLMKRTSIWRWFFGQKRGMSRRRSICSARCRSIPITRSRRKS